ncbi:MAG: hypothetical protein ACREBI_07120 [Nitrosotalea sp.]
MQKAEKKKPVMDTGGASSNKVSDAQKHSIRNELKRIRAENPDLYRALSLDKFD